jgi:hypothetical protein
MPRPLRRKRQGHDLHLVRRSTQSSIRTMSAKQHTVFFHPDLGIGGAERLVVDAAVALQSRGHRVTVFTSHCDPQHCFDEARDGKPRPLRWPPAAS